MKMRLRRKSVALHERTTRTRAFARARLPETGGQILPAGQRKGFRVRIAVGQAVEIGIHQQVRRADHRQPILAGVPGDRRGGAARGRGSSGRAGRGCRRWRGGCGGGERGGVCGPGGIDHDLDHTRPGRDRAGPGAEGAVGFQLADRCEMLRVGAVGKSERALALGRRKAPPARAGELAQPGFVERMLGAQLVDQRGVGRVGAAAAVVEQPRDRPGNAGCRPSACFFPGRRRKYRFLRVSSVLVVSLSTSR